MRYLLDTHILLWWLGDEQKLTNYIKEIISNPDNQIFISVASGWEIVIKQRSGKLPLKTTVQECFTKANFEILNINLNHILFLDKLPLYHHDPFDRILIAQAQVENLTFITSDEKIKKYKIKVV